MSSGMSWEDSQPMPGQMELDFGEAPAEDYFHEKEKCEICTAFLQEEDCD
jgi:hypothetical protein